MGATLENVMHKLSNLKDEIKSMPPCRGGACRDKLKTLAHKFKAAARTLGDALIIMTWKLDLAMKLHEKLRQKDILLA